MAKFDSRMPLTEGTNRVIDDPAEPSAVGAAFDFATATMTGYLKLQEDVGRTRAAKKAEEEKARQAQITYEVAGANDRATAAVATANSEFLASIEPKEVPVTETPSLMNDSVNFNMGNSSIDEKGVFTPGNLEVSPALRQEVSVAAQRAANFKAAEEQGRVPSITFNAAMNADFRRLRDKYPDQVEHIIDMYKKMGVDTNLFTEAKDAADQHVFEREMGQARITEQEKRNEDYIKLSIEAYGPIAAGWSREQQVVEGMRAANSAYQLRITGEKMRINKERREMADSDKKATQEELNTQFMRNLSKGVFDASQPFVQTVGNLVDAISRDPNNPDLLQRFQGLQSEAALGIDRYVSMSIQAAREAGYTGDYGQLEKEVRGAWKPILDMFSGDHSVVSSQLNGLRAVETALKVETATALPLFTALKAAGFDVAKMPAIMQGLETDKNLMGALRNELTGYRQDLLDDSGSARFTRILRILRGETSLAYSPPGSLKNDLASLNAANKSLVRNYLRDPSKVDGDMVVNGIGNITTRIRTLGPSNSMAVYGSATGAFATADYRKALINTLSDANVDREMAVATIQASRAGSAQLLNYYRANIGAVNKSSSYFEVKWNERDGKYVIDESKLERAIKRASNAPSSSSYVGGLSPTVPMRSGPTRGQLIAMRGKAPAEITRFVNGANINLDNAIELGRHDPTTPKATDVELRNWYGMEKPLKTPKVDKINPKQETEKMFKAAEEAIDQFRTDITGRSATSSPVNVEGLKGTIVEGEAGPKGYNSYYGDGQGGGGSDRFNFNLPKEVTKMTIQEAIDVGRKTMIPMTRGKIGHSNPNLGTSAIGAYQFTQETLAEFGKAVFGDNWRNVVLTPANQDKLADAIIEQTGGDPDKLVGRWPSLRGKL